MKEKQYWSFWILGVAVILIFVCLTQITFYSGNAIFFGVAATAKDIAFFGIFKLMIVFVITGFLLNKANKH